MLIVEIHGWRGIGRDRDLFWFHIRLGFLTLAINWVSAIDTLRDLRKAAIRMKAGVDGGPQ